MDKFRNFIDLIQPRTAISYVNDDSTIEITINQEINQQIIHLGFSSEIIQGRIRIASRQTAVALFTNYEDFQSRIIDTDFDLPILIIASDKGSVFYKNDTTYENFVEVKNNYVISNAKTYFSLLKFLATQEHKEDSAFYFVDHFNRDSRKIVFTSLKKEGKLTIPFSDRPIQNLDFDMSIKLTRFEEAFNVTNRHLPKFIKYELFNFLSKIEKENRMREMVLRLDEIIDTAEQNHEIYLSDLTLENLKHDYIEYKSMFQSQIREILSKITNQIVSLPLSLTASAFATYKVDDLKTQLAILIVFIVYSIYMVLILRMHKEDISEIQTQSHVDFNKLKKSSFFSRYPVELEDFENARDRIDQKVSILKRVIDTYFVTMLFTNAFFIAFIFSQVGVHFYVQAITFLTVLIGGLLIWPWSKQSSSNIVTN